ncbi:MAG: HAD hydrolase-like protein, partial [Ignavibacteria bacterium]|nr:HAD hydrolase-like protein [Ignavibacteria bacterium]
LADYQDAEATSAMLLKTQIKNLGLYGFGAKSFILSMLETTLEVTKNEVDGSIVKKILQLGKDLINKPVILLDGVKEVLESFHAHGFKLIVATKGDLLDQERKLLNSGIEKYFHHIEIMSDKKEVNYAKLLAHLEIEPKDFLMIGNSLKSDIIPVLNIGGYGVHIPFHTTWAHEEVFDTSGLKHYWELESISEIHQLILQ